MKGDQVEILIDRDLWFCSVGVEDITLNDDPDHYFRPKLKQFKAFCKAVKLY